MKLTFTADTRYAFFWRCDQHPDWTISGQRQQGETQPSSYVCKIGDLVVQRKNGGNSRTFRGAVAVLRNFDSL